MVTASGTTLLGSDDKSGVAVIMTLVERLLRETKRKHGLIRVCFTPDEEIGRGVDKLDLRMLGADVAYTLDGGAPGEICWETFSGDAAEVIIDGITTHPMEARAKGVVKATYLAGKLLAALPEGCPPHKPLSPSPPSQGHKSESQSQSNLPIRLLLRQKLATH